MTGAQETNSNAEAAGVPRVAVCIVNWNGWRDTIECVEAVRQFDYPNYVTVVVDNGSSDDSVVQIKSWAEHNSESVKFVETYISHEVAEECENRPAPEPDRVSSRNCVVLIRNQSNMGFTGGNNAAIHYALHGGPPADYVFLINNDAIPNVDSLSLMVAADRQTNAGIVGAVVVSVDGREVEFAKSGPPLALFFAPIVKAYVPMPANGKAVWESGYVNGAAMMIRKDVLMAVHGLGRGYLDDRLFLYWDELAFCNSARKLGFKCVVVRDAVVRHKGGKSSGGFSNPIYYYYSGRNRILLVSEFLPLGWRIAFHLIHAPMRLVSALNNLSAGRRRSAQAILLGLIDGYRGITGKWKRHD